MSGFSVVPERELNSVEEVASAMRDLRNYLRENKRYSMIPFLDAYLKITEEVIREKERGNFEHPEKLEKLDTRFGQLYFDAVRRYLENGEKKKPWRTYFNYIEREDSRPLLELLLGINAHINSDLAQTLHEQGYRNRKDFRKINRILEKSLIPVMKDTAVKRKDLETLGLLGFPPATIAGLHRVKAWRKHAMENSHRKNYELKEIRELTEENARKLIEIRHNTKPVQILRKPFQILSSQIKI